MENKRYGRIIPDSLRKSRVDFLDFYHFETSNGTKLLMKSEDIMITFKPCKDPTDQEYEVVRTIMKKLNQ